MDNPTITTTTTGTSGNITTTPAVTPTEPTPTPEELVKQIESLTAAMKKQKLALDNAAADAAEWKRQFRATQDEATRLKAEQEEAFNAIKAENAALKRDKAIEKRTNKYLSMGYPDELAKASAEAWADGDEDKVLDYQKQFNEQFETKIKAGLLAKQPDLTPGQTPTGVGAEPAEIAAFRKGVLRG